MEQVHPQDPGLAGHLSGMLAGQTFMFSEKTVLSEIGSKLNKTFFLASGYLTDSVFDRRGDKQVVFMYGSHAFRFSDFTVDKPCSCYLEAAAGTSGLYFSADQMYGLFEFFPAFRRAMSRILIGDRTREMEHRRLIYAKGEFRVLEFYASHPQMLPAGAILTDGELSSYLHLSEGAFRRLRNALIRAGKLPGHKTAELRRVRKLL